MLWQNPPHLCSLYSSVATNDDGGGTDITYSLEQAAIPCLINTVSSNTQLMFAQAGITVTNTVGILSSELTTTPKPGWKVVADDTGDSFHIEGIRSGRVSALGTIPPLTYLDCRQILS
jgi:hypothetical protein